MDPAPSSTAPSTGPTYLVIGCSSGIGLDLVKTLAARGDKVYATVRSKQGSKSGADAISAVEGDVTVIEGIDISKDDVGPQLAAALKGATIDVVIHNAGTLNGGTEASGVGMFAEQKFENITMDMMRSAFEVNALGPLRVQKAVQQQMKSPGGKVVVINTGMGSIGDNGSGGNLAYRTSKAAANMITRSMAMDKDNFKESGIMVASVAPGFVQSDFGPGAEAMAKMGAAPVGQATSGILKTIEAMTMENTGTFTMVPTDGGEPKSFPW